MKPKELEKRLAAARQVGYFDGYNEGVEQTHMIWVEESKKVEGIGPKRWAALIAAVFVTLQKRIEENAEHGKKE